MELRFDDDDLERLETDQGYNGGRSRDIVKAFRRRMQLIRAAKDERDFYGFKGIRFEKMKGSRKDDFSMRLNDQYRLIVQLENGERGKIVVIKSIEDYH